jgi:hypothetical protein
LEDGDSNPPPKQPFATAKLEPGEWDIRRRDPFYRPKPPRNSLISAEDFANRPPVGFEGEFSSYEDSMIALSWLDSKTSRQIYQMYVEMMVDTQQKYPGRTSHEYVCRVLAQRFHITPWRAAGVVQLQHNEEQMRRNHPELLCEEQAVHAEETILQNIRDAYKSEHSQPSKDQPFVEDPVGIHGRGEPDEISSSWVPADDIFDMEAKLQQANERDENLAHILIDEHVYKEDVDESSVEVKTDGAAKRLLKARQEYRENSTIAYSPTASGDIPYPETNTQGVKRHRWKYVAKVVNTRALRKKGQRITSYTNNNMVNTLVEEDGNLRVATVEEAKQVAWKPSRTKGNEYIYEGAKRAWLERTVKGKTDVWGKAPKTSALAATAKVSDTASQVDPKESHVGKDTAAAAAAATDGNSSTIDSEEIPVEHDGSAEDDTFVDEIKKVDHKNGGNHSKEEDAATK